MAEVVRQLWVLPQENSMGVHRKQAPWVDQTKKTTDHGRSKYRRTPDLTYPKQLQDEVWERHSRNARLAKQGHRHEVCCGP